MRIPTFSALIATALCGLILAPFLAIAESTEVSWTPRQVIESALPGTTVSVAVTLTATKNRKNVVLEVPLDLAPFVSVNPYQLGDLRKGDRVTLTLALRAPSDSLPMSMDGALRALRLKADVGESPDPPFDKLLQGALPISFKVLWPQVNLGGGVSVSYPPRLLGEVGSNGDVILTDPATDSDHPSQIVIRFEPNADGLSEEAFYDGERNTRIGDVFGTTTVAGRSAKQYFDGLSLSGTVAIVVPLPGAYLRILDLGAMQHTSGDLYRILSQLAIGGGV